MPSRLPRTFLGATKNQGSIEVPVTEIEPEHGIYTGIHLQQIGLDVVPVHEEHEARLERGISLADWGRMETMEKALLIASRRIRMAVQNINTDAEINKMEQESKRSARK